MNFRFTAESVEGLSLSKDYMHISGSVLVCAVESGEDGFNPGWRLYFKSRRQLAYCGFSSECGAVLQEDCPAKRKIKNAMICGGGRVAYYLASQLCKSGDECQDHRKKQRAL